MRPKQNRRAALRDPKTLYTVGCPGDCSCIERNGRCQRGFFSLWIQAIYGRYFAKRLGLASYIDFGDKPSLYSDPSQFRGDPNFWNYYYQQEAAPDGRPVVHNDFRETHPLRIWAHQHLVQVHRVAVADLVLRSEVKTYIEAVATRCRQQPTLGLQIRATDHPNEVEPVSEHTYLRVVRRFADRFPKFFIATDDQHALERVVAEFGEDRVVSQPATRSTGEQSVHKNMAFNDRYRLGLEVLADAFALSACSHAILVHSNVSYAALLMNPELPYTLLERTRMRCQRWFNRVVYRLNGPSVSRWGWR